MLAETDTERSESGLWHLRVAEGDRLSERSEGGKLPQRKTRALVVLRKLKTLLGGASGGMQGGPRRGRSPITGPALLRAAQASQLCRRAKRRARRAAKIKELIIAGEAIAPAPAGQQIQSAARRAATPPNSIPSAYPSPPNWPDASAATTQAPQAGSCSHRLSWRK